MKKMKENKIAIKNKEPKEIIGSKKIKDNREKPKESNEQKKPTWYEVYEQTGEGYLPLVDYESWRVAVLSYSDELLADEIRTMQRHDETDEVFVLLRGRCLLFLGGNSDRVEEIIPLEMKPFKIYNIKKSVWHNHTVSKDALVLIVENRDTTSANSPVYSLDQNQHQFLIDTVRELWPDVR
jgi:hypothetical protein